MADVHAPRLRTFQPRRPPRVLVVGDLMLDRTRWVTARRADHHTAGVVSHEIEATDQLGGAGYVASLLSHWQCDVAVAGVLGTDAEAQTLLRLLDGFEIDSLLVTDDSRPTTLKERIASHGPFPKVLTRIDRESMAELADELQQRLRERIDERLVECDAIVISDYAKGVCSASLATDSIAAARARGIPIIVDPARRRCFERFRGCDVITPNRAEAEAVTGMRIISRDVAIAAAEQIRSGVDASACIITLDANGAVVVTGSGLVVMIPASDVAVVDATGAGDAFAAAMAHSIGTGEPIVDAARQANRIAGEQVGRFGTCLVGREDITRRPVRNFLTTQRKLLHPEDLESVALRYRRQGRRIVFTNGCFDLLHPGHVEYLEQAAAEGDVLIVAVNSDPSVFELKGSGRPVMTQSERTRMVAALACVDFVVLFDEPTPHDIIRRLRPDVLVKGGDYSLEDVAGREFVEHYGGSVKTMGLTPGLSTTRILERLTDLPRKTIDAG